MELSLLLDRADKREAITIFEEVLDHPSDAILGLNLVTRTFLLLDGVLEVLFRSNLIAHGVMQAQGKVPDDPKEGWEIFRDLVGVRLTYNLRFDLKLFRQINL